MFCFFMVLCQGPLVAGALLSIESTTRYTYDKALWELQGQSDGGASGIKTVSPSRSLVSVIWHASLEV